ncbi:hypothetical protein ACFX19_041184 [Malus domestica]
MKFNPFLVELGPPEPKFNSDPFRLERMTRALIWLDLSEIKSPQSSSEKVKSRLLILGLGSTAMMNMKSPKPSASLTSATAVGL